MEVPSETEIILLAEFRDQISDLKLTGERNSDFYLLRWIRAREHKLKDAEEMLRKHCTWRTENDIDDLLHWEPSDNIPIAYPFEIVGFDKIGCPIILIPFGVWDVKAAVEKGHKEDLIRYVDYLFEISEHLMTQMSTATKPVTQFVLLFDFKDLSCWQIASVAAVEAILEIVRRFEQNHPETLRVGFVINASRIFSLLFKMVKPFLSPRTIGKLEIYGTNQTEWKAALLKEIPVKELPVSFGGEGSTSIKVYEKMEQNSNDLKRVCIAPGETVSLEYSIPIPGSKLCWKFQTEYYDIAFSIKMINEAGEVTQVQPYSRVESQIRKISGQINCKTEGKYILQFENSHGRKREKILKYNVTIVSPNINYG